MNFERSSEFFLLETKRSKFGGGRGNQGSGATPCQSTLIPDSKTDPIIIISTSRELTHLFLGSGLVVSLDASALLASTLVAGLGASLTETAVGSLLTLGKSVTLDLGDGLGGSDVLDGEAGVNAGDDAVTLALGNGSLGGLDVLGGRVELLELTALAGEEDEAGLVVLETGNVGDEGLLGVVGTAVVNRDTDGGSKLLGDTSFLLNESNQHSALSFAVATNFSGKFTFSSARVKPRPARTRRLYLTVGHRTTGRSLSTGRGATAAALAMRASRRRCFRPGCAIHVSRPNSHPAKKIFFRFRFQSVAISFG